ncbi:MAG: LysR family transcriptional regulator [Pseudomonadota bacterium]
MEAKLPNLNATMAVLEVAEHGSFSKAAQQLGLSASATSKTVARLEEALGVKLFHRTTRNVSLTPEGEQYVEGVKPLLRALDAVTTELSDRTAAPKGLLRVSAPVAYGRMQLVPKLAAFRQAYPAVELDVALQDRSVDMAAGKVDVAIRTGALPDNVNLVARRLFDDAVITCASTSYLNRNGRPDSLDALATHECVRFRNDRTGRLHPWRFSTGTVSPGGHAFVINDAEAVAYAALADAGIVQIPEYMFMCLKVEGLEEVLTEYRPSPVVFSAIYLERRLVSAKIRALVDFLAAETP